jgi:hypothetical protein
MSEDGFLTHYKMLENHIAELEAELEILKVKNTTLATTLEFWKGTAEARGDEISRLTTLVQQHQTYPPKKGWK